MNDYAYQSVTCQYQLALLFPEGRGIRTQNVKERIILRGSDRDFQYLSDKVGHYRAAPARLRVQMPYVGNGHVIRTLQCIEPAQIPVQRSRPESLRIKLLQVAVNFPGATQKFFPGPKKIAVVAEIVDINLAAALPYLLEKCGRYLVTFFRYHLIRGFESKFVVGIHQSRAKISP